MAGHLTHVFILLCTYSFLTLPHQAEKKTRKGKHQNYYFVRVASSRCHTKR